MVDATSIYKPQYQGEAKAIAAQYGIPQEIFLSLVQQESSWNPYATGSAGEWGFTQLKQGTADEVGANRYDPIGNLKGGAAYLSKQFKATGNWFDALRSYNAGPTGAKNNANAGAKYAEEILTRAQSYGYDGKQATAPTGTKDPNDLTPFEKSLSEYADPTKAFGRAWEWAKMALGYSPPAAMAVSAVTGENIPWNNSEWFFTAVLFVIVAAIVISLMWSSVQSIFNMGAPAR